MSRPFVAPRLPLDAAVSDPLARLAHLENLSVFHTLFLAHQSRAESCSRPGLWPRSPWTNDHTRRIPSLADGRQRSGITRQAGHLGPGTGRKAARNVSPTCVSRQRRWLPAHRRRSRQTERINLVLEIGQGVREQTIAVRDVTVAREQQRTIRLKNSSPHYAAVIAGVRR
jgi:hypothetical protein